MSEIEDEWMIISAIYEGISCGFEVKGERCLAEIEEAREKGMVEKHLDDRFYEIAFDYYMATLRHYRSILELASKTKREERKRLIKAAEILEKTTLKSLKEGLVELVELTEENG